MKIVIEISDKDQAESFLLWAKYRGDVTLGDEQEIKAYSDDSDWHSAYVYITSASEIGNDSETGHHSSDSSTSITIEHP